MVLTFFKLTARLKIKNKKLLELPGTRGNQSIVAKNLNFEIV